MLPQTEPRRRISSGEYEIDAKTSKLGKKKPKKKQTWYDTFANAWSYQRIGVFALFIVAMVIVYVCRIELGLVQSDERQILTQVEAAFPKITDESRAESKVQFDREYAKEQQSLERSREDKQAKALEALKIATTDQQKLKTDIGRESVSLKGFQQQFPNSLLFPAELGDHRQRLMHKVIDPAHFVSGAEFVMLDWDETFVSIWWNGLTGLWPSRSRDEFVNMCWMGTPPAFTVCGMNVIDVNNIPFYAAYIRKQPQKHFLHYDWCINPEVYYLLPNLRDKHVIIYTATNSGFEPTMRKILDIIGFQSASLTFIFKESRREAKTLVRIRRAIAKSLPEQFEFKVESSFIGFDDIKDQWAPDFDVNGEFAWRRHFASTNTKYYKESDLVHSAESKVFDEATGRIIGRIIVTDIVPWSYMDYLKLFVPFFILLIIILAFFSGFLAG